MTTAMKTITSIGAVCVTAFSLSSSPASADVGDFVAGAIIGGILDNAARIERERHVREVEAAIERFYQSSDPAGQLGGYVVRYHIPSGAQKEYMPIRIDLSGFNEANHCITGPLGQRLEALSGTAPDGETPLYSAYFQTRQQGGVHACPDNMAPY